MQNFVAAALEEERLAALWVLAASTGMRPEEYLGLAWPDLGPGFRSLTIQRVLVRSNKAVKGQPNWRFESPKTEKSRRTLELEPEMAELLVRHRAVQDAEKEAADSGYEDNSLVYEAILQGAQHSTKSPTTG